MTVKVLYFAALRDLAGCAEESLSVPEAVRTVGQFVKYLERVRPEFAGRLGSVRVAVDEAFADADAVLGSARELALIPPVAGG